MFHNTNPIICAVDTQDISYASDLASKLEGSVGALKLGLEYFTANGAAGVQHIARHRFPIFLDLKFHDIPNTVAKAIKATAGIDTFMMTVHTAGGRAMLRAAIDASMEVADMTGKERPLIIGVTVLTSLDQDDLSMVGINSPLHDQVKRLADLAESAGLDGVVCSPYEIKLLREHCGDDFTLVVPGIRPAGSAKGDQKRVMTPREALEEGANYIVIGRPITGEDDPRAAAESILRTLS
ncbi:MAG: orotidine-5'-phosphate decarboxylase [Alphaproteobacteria bacterium]